MPKPRLGSKSFFVSAILTAWSLTQLYLDPNKWIGLRVEDIGFGV